MCYIRIVVNLRRILPVKTMKVLVMFYFLTWMLITWYVHLLKEVLKLHTCMCCALIKCIL